MKLSGIKRLVMIEVHHFIFDCVRCRMGLVYREEVGWLGRGAEVKEMSLLGTVVCSELRKIGILFFYPN